MKNHICLIAFMSSMFFLSQPAWSMEESNMQGQGVKRKNPEKTEGGVSEQTPPTKKTKLENEEPENFSSAFMNIPTELRWHIFSFLCSSENNGIDPELLSLSLVSKQIHNEVSHITFLRLCLEKTSPHLWTGEDKDWDQPLLLFHVLKKKSLSYYLRNLGKGCYLFKGLLLNSNSRLLAYRLALAPLEDIKKQSIVDKELMENKMSEAVGSLFWELLHEDEPEKGFHDPRKDAAFLLIYYGQPNKSELIDKRLRTAKKAIVEGPEEKQCIPSYLLRIMSVKDQSLSINEKGEFFEELTYRNDAIGQFNFTVWYNAPQNDFWLKKAAQQGLPEAQVKLWCFTEAGRGVSWLEKAAQQGLAGAQYELGNCYARENGVIQDDVQAVSWWRRAAEQGIHGAQYNLALAYEQGKGTSQDLTQAVYWYQRGIDEGAGEIYHEFTNALATLYETGRGVSQDLRKARRLYGLAINEDSSIAKINLETFDTGALRLRDGFITDPYVLDNFILTSECGPVGEI